MSARTVLCIDDDKRIRATVRTVMTAASWEVWEAETGQQGLALAHEGPDVVILDVVLPDTHGFEVCRQLKTAAPTARIPVLLLSGEEIDDDAQVAGLEGGADAYLVKPVSGKVLLATVNALDRMARAERSLAEALRETEAAHAAKDRFLVSMTGKLRLPINTVLATAGSLLDSALTPHQREQVSLVRNSADRLLALVNNILDATRLDMDGIELEASVFDVRSVVRDAVEMAREQGVLHKAEVSLTFADGMPRNVHADAGRLAQVLFHVLTHAARRADNGRVHVTVAQRSGDGETACLAVDVGHGGAAIPAAERNRLFDPLHELSCDEASSDGSLEFGLAISASVIALLGGKIGYRDHADGQGAFWFSLPVENVKDAPECVPPAQADSGGIPAGLCVLVADDNRVNRKVAAGVLKSMGVEVTLAENGEQAVDLAREQPFDLVLMDLQMPEMDGFEATRRIRAAGNAATPPDVPIVALTAQGDADSVALAEVAGMSGYMVKPLSKAVLEVTIAAQCAAAVGGREDSGDASAVGPDPGIFNTDDLLERLDGDREVMKEVLELFVTESQKDLRRAQEAAEAHDWEQVARVGHALKGAAANVGAEAARAAAAALETAGRSSDPPAAAARLPDAKAAFDAACGAMRGVLEAGQKRRAQ